MKFLYLQNNFPSSVLKCICGANWPHLTGHTLYMITRKERRTKSEAWKICEWDRRGGSWSGKERGMWDCIKFKTHPQEELEKEIRGPVQSYFSSSSLLKLKRIVQKQKIWRSLNKCSMINVGWGDEVCNLSKSHRLHMMPLEGERARKIQI